MDATGLSRTQIPCCYGLLSESVDFRGPGWMSMSIIDHQDHAASLRSAPVSLRATNNTTMAKLHGTAAISTTNGSRPSESGLNTAVSSRKATNRTMPTIGIAAAIRQPPRQRRKHQIGATSPNSARPNTVAMNALNQTLSACVIGCCGPPVAATTLSFSVATHAGAGGAAPAVVLPATDTRWTSAGFFKPLLLPMKTW